MKVLLVSNFFPPSHNAGTEKRTLGYALQLKKAGFAPKVVCAGNWDVGLKYWNGINDQLYYGIPVRRINLNWNLAPDPNQYLYKNPIIGDYFGSLLREWQPDLVHVTSCYTMTASVIEKAEEFGIPVILTLTDYWFICPKHTLLRNGDLLCDGRTTNFECQDCMLEGNNAYKQVREIIPTKWLSKGLEWFSKHHEISSNRGMRGMVLNMGERKKYLSHIMDLPNVVIAPSQYLADVYNGSGISRPIRVIKSGHDLSWLENLPAKGESEIIQFGYIGQVSHIKGVHTLISAFSLLKQTGKSKLVIYGDAGKDKRYTSMLALLIERSNQDISFRGSFSHNLLGKILAEIDVLVVPSLWYENNPRVIQEAFASKTPVIASNVGGISEFVDHEVNGLLFKRGDEEDLSYQLSRVIDNPDLISNLSRGIKPVKMIESEVEEIITIYRELVE